MYFIYQNDKFICFECKVYDQHYVHTKDTMTWVHIQIGEDFGYGSYLKERTTRTVLWYCMYLEYGHELEKGVCIWRNKV